MARKPPKSAPKAPERERRGVRADRRVGGDRRNFPRPEGRRMKSGRRPADGTEG